MGETFMGFDAQTSPNFEEFAMQSGFPAARTFLESAVYNEERPNVTREQKFAELLNEFDTANRIWNRLVTEHGWEKEDFGVFKDIFMTYIPIDRCTYLGFALDNKAEEYSLIEHANRTWNVHHPDQTRKAESLPEEELASRLQRFDEAHALERQKNLDDLHGYTHGADITDMNNDKLRSVFGTNALSIIHIRGSIERDAQTTERLRTNLIEQYKPAEV